MNDATKTTPQRILPKKANDSKDDPGLLADNVIAAGQKINLFDLQEFYPLTVMAWTDIVAEGGYVDSILARVTQPAIDGGEAVVVEFDVGDYVKLVDNRFLPPLAGSDKGDRNANISQRFTVTLSDHFEGLGGVTVNVNMLFIATLNVKNGDTEGHGWFNPQLASLPAEKLSFEAVETALAALTFEIIGWTPHLHFTGHGPSA